MIFGSVCSGIEAASVAWEPLGWKAAFLSEIEAFPCAVLKHYYPLVPNHGDMNRFKDWPDATLDVLVGGTPCQAFSVAGLRKGLADPRGNLTLVYLAIAARYRPKWLVWENVPGVLSDGTGAFSSFLGGLAELGYGFAYRVLDAQFFGVPQRRRRVFVVGCLGDWRAAAAVLFERESLRGDPAPRREARQRVAGSLRSGPAGGRSHGKLNGSDRMELVPMIAGTLGAHSSSGRSYGSSPIADNLVSHSLRADGLDASEDGTGRWTPLVPVVTGALACNTGPAGHDAGNFASNQGVDAGFIVPVAYDERNITSVVNSSNPQPGDPCHTLHKPRDTILAFSSKDHGADAGETSPTLRAMGHAGSHANAGGQVAVAVAIDTLQPQGYNRHHASAQEADAITALRVLREALGEEAFAEWRSGILDSLQAPQVLRQDVHGGCIRRQADEGKRRVGDGALPCAQDGRAWALRAVWKAGCERRSPQGRGFQEQHARKLDAALSQLPHEGSPPEWLVQGLWREGEGSRSVQSTLHPVQGRPLAVRRLTPIECERLMGFPDDYTLVQVRGKPAADGPRYKALGNSMAVPVMRWIGQRIAAVSAVLKQAA